MIKQEIKKLIFKSNAPFRSCISKINNTFVGNAEDLDMVMPMYNLLENSDNYSMTSGSSWNFYRDEINDSAIENNDDGNKINNNKTITSKSFEYKIKIGRTPSNDNILDTEVVVPLKYLRSFGKFVNLPLISCEKELDLSWSKECIISEISITPELRGDNPMDAIQTTGAKCQINNVYFTAVTLSINDSIKFLENIK